MKRCQCPPREFVPTDAGVCYRCGGVPRAKCRTCDRMLTDSEIAGGTCNTCGQQIGGSA